MNFGIVFGGASFEHEISIVSAIALQKVLKNELVFIFLDSEHKFYLIDSNNMKASFFAKGLYKQCPELSLGIGGFYEIKGFFKRKSLLKIHTFYSLIHGADGEDGTLSALFDFYKIFYIAPRVEACVLSFDKALTKLYATSRGVKVLEYEVLNQSTRKNLKQNFPLILKPARLGSSIGVNIVRESKELNYALDSAFEYDENVVVEAFIENVKEYNLAGCKIKDEFIFSLVEEPKKNEILDFENKYLDFSRTQSLQRAEISQNLQNALQENFVKIYENMFEGAIVRCDFFVINDEVYLNEINPIPGSGANYLFENFEKVLENLACNLPKKKPIKVNYSYIEQITRAKGK
ncbi:D-alanine--D-alanine ligase [Helicobacter himalayensis]|uniref:D-alanine--D-alanine ligase n=1 Tax=Helicobacter himalayensis TaxID=1591088 RepID=UPI000830AB39|nr:D-alanine--D-alanine ligase [Helicobacter himalayensis]